MKITKCVHVTATERKHLTAFLNSGMTQAKVNRKHYVILQGTPQGDKYLYKIRIATPVKNDYGDTVYNTQTIEVLK